MTGDYFYSDGTYSPEIEAHKDIIGIVFWTGDPTAGDERLGKDFPGCTSGLVLAARGQVRCRWSATSAPGHIPDEDPGHTALNSISGYGYTNAMEASVRSGADHARIEALEKVLNHRAACPAPACTSGWYMPSAKEVSLFISGRYDGDIYEITSLTEACSYLNRRLSAVPGAQLIDTGSMYWSSCEYDSNQAYLVAASSGNVLSFLKNLPLPYVRCVLAF